MNRKGESTKFGNITIDGKYVTQFTFAHHALIRLVDASHAILKLAVTLWQFLGDEAWPSWNVLAMGEKHSLTDLKFISRHHRPHANRISITLSRALLVSK